MSEKSSPDQQPSHQPSQQSTDQIHRFIFDNTDIRGEITTLKNSYQEATSHQDLPDWCKCLLGEFIAAVSLLSETLKFDGLLTLQVRGEGSIPLIMAETDNLGHVRGILKRTPNASIPESEATLPETIGKGVLVLTVDPKSGERYQGVVPLEKDSLALCLSDYFARSEQLNTKFLLFSNTEYCGGLLLQALPMQKEKDLDLRKEQWDTTSYLADTLKAVELFSIDHHTILYRLFNEMTCRVFSGKTVQFKCQCSRKRSANAVGSLGMEDAKSLIAEQGAIDINCEFCGSQFAFGLEDLPEIFGNGTNETFH